MYFFNSFLIILCSIILLFADSKQEQDSHCILDIFEKFTIDSSFIEEFKTLRVESETSETTMKPFNKSESDLLGIWQNRNDGSQFLFIKYDRTLQLYGHPQLTFTWRATDDSLYIIKDSITYIASKVTLAGTKSFSITSQNVETSFQKYYGKHPLYTYDPLKSALQFIFNYDSYIYNQMSGGYYIGNESTIKELLGKWELPNIHDIDSKPTIIEFTENGKIKMERKRVGYWEVKSDTLYLNSKTGTRFPVNFSVSYDSLYLINIDASGCEEFTRKK